MSEGADLKRLLFSLKTAFQADRNLVYEFVSWDAHIIGLVNFRGCQRALKVIMTIVLHLVFFIRDTVKLKHDLTCHLILGIPNFNHNHHYRFHG